jgi:hypothetical protein
MGQHLDDATRQWVTPIDLQTTTGFAPKKLWHEAGQQGTQRAFAGPGFADNGGDTTRI